MSFVKNENSLDHLHDQLRSLERHINKLSTFFSLGIRGPDGTTFFFLTRAEIIERGYEALKALLYVAVKHPVGWNFSWGPGDEIYVHSNFNNNQRLTLTYEYPDNRAISGYYVVDTGKRPKEYFLVAQAVINRLNDLFPLDPLKGVPPGLTRYPQMPKLDP